MPHHDVILAGASVRSLAESAIRDGLRPACIDMFADADLRRLLLGSGEQKSNAPVLMRSFEELPAILEKFDPAVPIIIAGGIENHLSVLHQLSADRMVAISSVAAIRSVRDPQQIYPALKRAGCNVPEWHWAHTFFGNAQFDRAKEWLLKDCDSCGGLGVTSLAGIGASADSGQRTTGRIVQQQIDGIPISATFMRAPNWRVEADDTSHRNPHEPTILLGVALQLCGQRELNASGFQFCGNAGPIELSETYRRQVTTAGAAVANHGGLTGLFGVDFVVRGSEVWVIEVNPRLTASHELHEFSEAVSSGHVSLQLACFRPDRRLGAELDTSRAVFQKKIVRMVIYSDRQLVVAETLETDLLSRCRAAGGHRSCQHLWLADVPPAGSSVEKHWPLCSVYVDLGAVCHLFELSGFVNQLPIAVPELTKSFLLRMQVQIDDLQSEPNLSNS